MGVHRTAAMSGWGKKNPQPTGRELLLVLQIFISYLQHTLSGWTIAFVRPVGAIPRSVAPPSFGQAAVLVFASEFLLPASGAGEFVVSQAAILSAVADPAFGNARVVVVATVLVRQAFTFGSCTSIHGRFPFLWRHFSEENEAEKEKEKEDDEQKSQGNV